MAKQITIKDVAKKAGVSVATASRVLSDSGYPVRPALQQKVREAAEELEYSPNAFAQALRGDLCKDIALIIPNLSNPFYQQAVLGAGEALDQDSYSIRLCNTMHDPERERDFIRQLYDRQVRGVILSSVAQDNAEFVNKYIQKGMKFVLLDQMLPGVDAPCIDYDSRAGARSAVEYLLELGHKKIAFATTPLVRFTRKEIHAGYCKALTAAGITPDDKLLYERSMDKSGRGSDYELNIGRLIAGEMLKNGCDATAVVCINDMIAIGLIQALTQNGVRVPQDISVVGFDNIPLAGAYVPALTTVHCPAQEMGRLAAIMLLDALRSDEQTMAVSMRLRPKLVTRDSAQKPKNI